MTEPTGCDGEPKELAWAPAAKAALNRIVELAGHDADVWQFIVDRIGREANPTADDVCRAYGEYFEHRDAAQVAELQAAGELHFNSP